MSRRKLSSHRSKTPNPANSLGYVASRLFFDVIIRRSIRRGEKLEEVKKKKKNYQRIYFFAGFFSFDVVAATKLGVNLLFFDARARRTRENAPMEAA